MTTEQKTEFYIENRTRGVVFVLLYVTAFLVSIWIVPPPFNYFVIGFILTSLPLICSVAGLRRMLQKQIFDRIALRKFGVEYSSGIFGDSWLRPYNEFRVECREQNILFWKRFDVRLKHRVLSNFSVLSTRSQKTAENVVRQLVENSRLRVLRK